MEDDFVVELSPMIDAEAKGCFSRPDEPEREFLAAAASWAPSEGSWEYPPHVKELFADRFGVDLGAVPLRLSSKGLMPWELACCWLDEEGRGSIQMRPSVGPKGRVPLDVVLVHEAVHAVRGRLNASKFEEHAAYSACREAFPGTFPAWRVWIGPLFSSVREVLTLLVLLWGSWGVPIFFNSSIPFWAIAGADGIIVSAFLLRLQRRWTVWERAMRAVVSHWPATAWRLMIRMADEDVEWLSEAVHPREEIEKRAAQEWRWRYLLDYVLIPLPGDQGRL